MGISSMWMVEFWPQSNPYFGQYGYIFPGCADVTGPPHFLTSLKYYLDKIFLVRNSICDRFIHQTLYLYKQTPSAELSHCLSAEFDTLFSTTTGYAALDERIAKSRAKKQELLAVLRHPQLPLHNNPAEHGARTEKRRKDVSLQTKTPEGTRAKDTMMSIVETCKKLGVSAYHFIYDRISQNFQLPSLADMIRAKATSQSIRDKGT